MERDRIGRRAPSRTKRLGAAGAAVVLAGGFGMGAAEAAPAWPPIATVTGSDSAFTLTVSGNVPQKCSKQGATVVVTGPGLDSGPLAIDH